MYCAITKKPALVLSKELLTNNANGKAYSWSRVISISYNQETGIRMIRSGCITIALRDPEGKICIPQNSIKCETHKLLHDLRKYHKAYLEISGKKKMPVSESQDLISIFCKHRTSRSVLPQVIMQDLRAASSSLV